jgi:transcriptional regulator with XRE-family HTH domain
VDISEVMRSRRAELGRSQAQLAQEADVHVRQIARYESGEQQPLLGVAVKLARALDISLAQLAGEYTHDLDLEGTWWAGWETVKDGEPWVAIQEVKAHQHGNHLQLTAERTRPVEEGGYNWTGELRLWDQEALMGWYRGADGSVRSKGTMYFALHPQGIHARGRWVGLSYDGEVITGHASLARTPEIAERVLRESIEKADQP